jgi:tetratricopeptide (TPR) repeat protein
MLKDAIDLHRQGRFDEAERSYRACLAERADDAEALHLLGMLRYQRGDAGEGARLLARAQELAPDDADIALSRASVAFRAGEHEEARRGFHHALTLDPNLGGAHAGIGQVALLRGERDLAEHHFRIALRTGEHPHALAGLGALLLERGDLDGALRHLGRAADLAPYDAMLQMMLGQAYLRRGTPAFAEQAFANALRLKPDLHPARPLLASLLLKAGRRTEAAAEYAQLLEVPGFEAAAQVGLGDVMRAEERFEDAVGHYRAALARDPAQVDPVRALAWSLTRLGRIEEGIAAYQDALEHLPEDPVLNAGRADLLMLARRLPEAAAAWREALRRNPADMQAHLRLALLCEYMGQLDPARAHAALALRARPDDVEMQLVRIRALLREGDDSGAAAALDALAALPLGEGPRRLLANYRGRLHDRAGETAAAARCFAEAQRGMPSALPPLEPPRPELAAALEEPPGPAGPAPVLLLGTPGSGVERIAALLADQPGLVVLRDRAAGYLREDEFALPRFPAYCGELGEEERAALRERWWAPLRAAGIDESRTVVDWLPRWDAHLLALVRRAMPGTRLVIVERDPRDALLNWLAFGAWPGFACEDPVPAAQWLARARAHLAHGRELPLPERLVVDADAVIASPAMAGAALARFLGLEALEPGTQFAAGAQGLGGLPAQFPAGHWQAYREALAEAFAALA